MSISVVYANTFKGTPFNTLQKRCFDGGANAQPGIMEAFASAGFAVKGQKMRVMALANGEMVGYAFGWLMDDGKFFLASSAVDPDFRRRGIYYEMHRVLTAAASEMGAHTFWSQHRSANNAILIAKLRLGYKVTGASHLAGGELNIYLSATKEDLRKAEYAANPNFGEN